MILFTPKTAFFSPLDGFDGHLAGHHRGFNTPENCPTKMASALHLLTPPPRQRGLPAHPSTLSCPTHPHPHPRPHPDLVRWQLVTPVWLAALMQGQAVLGAPQGRWQLVEVGCGEPADFLHSHIHGACYLDTHQLKDGPFWSKMQAVGNLQPPGRALTNIRTWEAFSSQTSGYAAAWPKATLPGRCGARPGIGWEEISVYDGGWFEWSVG